MTYGKFIQDFNELEKKLMSLDPKARHVGEVIATMEDDLKEDLEYLVEEKDEAKANREIEEFDDEVPPALKVAMDRMWNHFVAGD